MADFTLDPQLATDTLRVGLVDNIAVRLMRDARYWWLILVPQIAAAQEWQDLLHDRQQALFTQTMRCADALRDLAGADKMNIAALGNTVRQLHVHVIARHIGDAAWPNPVWGAVCDVGAPEAYVDEKAARRIEALCSALTLN